MNLTELGINRAQLSGNESDNSDLEVIFVLASIREKLGGPGTQVVEQMLGMVQLGHLSSAEVILHLLLGIMADLFFVGLS